jgi:tetratricopeptide (TPR) repeat protein
LAARWPDLFYTYPALCNFYLNVVDNPSATEKWATEMMRRFPERAGSRSWLAWAYWHQERWEEAAELFKQAITMRSNNFWDYRGLCQVLIQLDRPNEALDVVRSWVDRRPLHAFGWQVLSWAYAVAGKHYQAVAACERVLELNPSTFLEKRARSNLSVMYMNEGRHEKAIETLQGLAAIDSNNADPWRSMAWLAWFGMRDSTLARKAARTAIRLDSDDDAGSLARADGHYILGDIAREEDELTAAVDHYKQARDESVSLITRYPEHSDDYAEAIFTAGLTNARIGEMEEARKYAAWLLENQKQGARFFYCYAATCIYSLTGDLEKAFEALDAAIDGGYRDKIKLLNDPNLENLRSDSRFQELYESIK